MTGTLAQAFRRGFLGNAPAWYKRLVFAFLLVEPDPAAPSVRR